MKPPTIQALLSGLPTSLGAYAPVLEEIEVALQSPQCSLSTLEEAIEKDPDLTARLLRFANSAFYGFSSRLSTLTEAISLVGIQQVQDLILASSILDQFAGVSVEFVDMGSFWRHSLACGIGARLLAAERRLPRADKFFVAGLLHDVGRLVLFSQAPEATVEILQLYRRERLLLRDAENKVLGYDHQQIAEALLQLWKFPVNLVQAITYHHHPAACPNAREEAAVVHLSDHLVNAMQIGSSGERHVPPLDALAWHTLHLPLESLSPVMSAIDEQVEAVQDIFLNRAIEA